MNNWFCELSQLNCTDLGQAINDIALQLNVTIFFLLLLVVGGVVFAFLSRPKKRIRQTPEIPIQQVIELEPHKISLTTELWVQKQQHKNATRPESMPKLVKAEIVQPDNSWWANFLQGISTEFFGAVVTTILLGLGVLVFQQYQSIQNHKAELILQMGSPNNAFAIEAVRQIKAFGWLYDGTLVNANLYDANLISVNLTDADLTDIYLLGANLTDAYMWRTDLTDANLQSADLINAHLVEVNFTNADLSYANLAYAILQSNLTYADLAEANLIGANLRLAYLTGANLYHANLTDVRLSQGTTLPDNTRWTEETDMARFTDSNHPDYWNPCFELDTVPWYCRRQLVRLTPSD